uniref:Si:dkey-83h2.3 n=1 Tax=Cynoglossus semilaevis TaxID=244447 RepID=A0A3P8VL53_CYNSE
MCVSRCLQCVGRSLAVLALICMLSNVLLLLPQLKIHFLLEGHVTREATWATGLWASGLMVCYMVTRCVCVCLFLLFLCLLAASICCLVSVTGLVQGPLCLYNATTDTSSSDFRNPHSVVEWNIVLFSVMGVASLLQNLVLCIFSYMSPVQVQKGVASACIRSDRSLWSFST